METTEDFITDKITRMQLSNLRKSMKLTQKDISEKTGLSLNCISNIESGEDKTPTLRSMIKYLNALGYEMTFKKKEV